MLAAAAAILSLAAAAAVVAVFLESALGRSFLHWGTRVGTLVGTLVGTPVGTLGNLQKTAGSRGSRRTEKRLLVWNNPVVVERIDREREKERVSSRNHCRRGSGVEKETGTETETGMEKSMVDVVDVVDVVVDVDNLCLDNPSHNPSGSGVEREKVVAVVHVCVGNRTECLGGTLVAVNGVWAIGRRNVVVGGAGAGSCRKNSLPAERTHAIRVFVCCFHLVDTWGWSSWRDAMLKRCHGRVQ